MGKRALIVDDSKSARLSLARILEKHAIEVDAAESAEQAIEYLWTHRPDAIFMDHNMPGMDGFQAVQTIKNNPRTATIPIMMYTSQEGELYLGQARALGAIGVLPKQIKQTDLTKVLYQLNLAVDRRSNEPIGNGAFGDAALGNGLRPQVEVLASNDDVHVLPDPGVQNASAQGGALREQLIELRRTVLAGFDNQGDRLLADMRTVLQDLHSPPPTPGSSAPPRAWLPWALTAALAGAGLLLVLLFWQQGARLVALQEELVTLKASAPQSAALAPAPDAAVPPADGAAATAASTDGAGEAHLKPIIQPVPYGVEPFSGARLDGLRQLFDRLTAQGFQGNVDIRTYSGRFCLVGNASEGYSLAPDDLPYAKCDVVSGTRDDASASSAASAMRIPVAMADLVGTVRASSHDLIHVQISGGDGNNVAAYPPASDVLTAGEWNHAASANNRIEIHVR